MDSQRSGGAGDGEPQVEDEFACAGMLRGSLTSLRETVERIFRVAFGIGADDMPHGDSGQMWLKLRGPAANVKAAKLFVKGLVNQEEQQEVSYPAVLHCIFCGARGLFTDSLIRNTSAHIVVGSPGFLLISGLAEPVVRAYSLIADLVARYEGAQSRRAALGDRALGESLDSRRAFKTLVEKWEDRHTLDLLVLPGAVKEIVLDLVKESGLGSSPRTSLTDEKTGTRGKAEGAEERLLPPPQEAGKDEQFQQQRTLDTEGRREEQEDREQDRHLSMGNKEFWLLLKFFTAMGYTEDVVKRVLARTGPKEASQILDLVQQEQDHSDREQAPCRVPGPKNPESVGSNQVNKPCETEHTEYEGTAAGGGKATGCNGEIIREGSEEGAAGGRDCSVELGQIEREEDFVLGVVKKAAVSCGYSEQNVAKVYNMVPDGSTRRLLLELQREGGRQADGFREEPKEIDDVVYDKEGPKAAPAEARGEFGRSGPEEERKSHEKGQVRAPDLSGLAAEADLAIWTGKPQQLPLSSQYTPQPTQWQPLKPQATHKVALSEVKGPPMPIYSSSLDPVTLNFQSNKQHGQTRHWADPPMPKPNHQPHGNSSTPKHHSSISIKQALQAQSPFVFGDRPPAKGRERESLVSPSSVVVTGEQRFLEGLQTSFELKLTDEPGDPKLRTIIIDGSNVAMSHGLGHFFSCRGIALAVQHFWDRGHRHISALLPQWRQKSDPRIKEPRYQTELQKLGLLSYTPSREVHGKRISSYDDRFMLKLAQETGGVIVTNDNLRDLSDESPAWRDIIKKSLLQYTFVGDLFMIPDDPLGRGGPHLDDFLRSEHRGPDPRNHSFAGLATASSSHKPPRSQTEILNFRDRTPGAALEASGGRGRGKGGAQGKGWDEGHRPGQLEANRTPEETAGLRDDLSQIFPDQDNTVTLVLQCHLAERDINVLSDLILQQQGD
ncbi:protein KHNYN isoform 1-T2 [Menidia menidia]